ncbi:MAG TPA: hypothetical protein VEL12_15500 [Candidatus Nitrosopolaris sp.]|nr:hypothetical protein [Candidatus Nitrosopolaris sp.]
MPDGAAAGVEVLAVAMEEFIVALGRGVAHAQTELDRAAIATQRQIDTDPELSLHGIQATWYQMPRAELEIKVALAFQSAPAPPSGPQLIVPPRIWIQPVNARYQNQFRFDATATSTVRLSIVPVPPRTTDALQAPAKFTADVVTALATPLLDKEPGTNLPRKDSRVVANFNAAARVWYVLQSVTVQGAVSTLAVVEVDDETGRAIKR